MTKSLKLSYIMLFIFSAIIIAFKTISNFLGGVGLNFVAIIGIMFVLVLIMLKDKETTKRIWDMVTLTSVLALLEFVIYFACEFGEGMEIESFMIFQNVISGIGLLILFYICFRFTFDFLNKKIMFIEIILGNEKRTKKVKKAKKEVTNGSLLEKPNSTQEQPIVNEEVNLEQPETETQEETIIIETEE